jgi:hypothetical protein
MQHICYIAVVKPKESTFWSPMKGPDGGLVMSCRKKRCAALAKRMLPWYVMAYCRKRLFKRPDEWESAVADVSVIR